MMRLIRNMHRKSILLALVVAIALSICPVDHLMPMATAATHSDDAVAECMPDACATLESKKMLSRERAVAPKLLLVPTVLPLAFKLQSSALQYSINGDSAPPPTTNNLYTLHATYLI